MKSSRKKRMIVSVTNDLVTDQRVHKVCTSLQEFGYDVLLVGRSLPASPELSDRSYPCRRMRLFFRRSVLFYAEYNLRLFFLLLFSRAYGFLSNDLDTLPANFLAARLRGKKLYYDSHEYFTEVPELLHRPGIKKVWETLEKLMLPSLTHTYTVSQAVADAYVEKYHIRMQVIRNFPRKAMVSRESGIDLKEGGKRILLYQGVVNVDRGLEEAVEAMKYVPDTIFYIAGRGDIDHALREQVRTSGLEDRVRFLGAIPFEQLPSVTAQADLGLSIEKMVGLNYTYALPNKLFDYIHAGVPVLVSPLPEIKKVLEQYWIGAFIESHDPRHIAEKINALLNDSEGRSRMKAALKEAREVYCWEKEEEKLRQLFETQ